MIAHFASKQEAAQYLQLSGTTLKRYRLQGLLIEGIHWVRINSRCIRYNLDLIQDWLQNRHDPIAHQRAIDQKARHSKEDLMPLRIIYMSGEARKAGIEEHQIEGVTVPVYSVAKTVVDCFKFRHKIGLDIALEALRDCWHQKRCSMDELWYHAKICRMKNVMRPYLDFLE